MIFRLRYRHADQFGSVAGGHMQVRVFAGLTPVQLMVSCGTLVMRTEEWEQLVAALLAIDSRHAYVGCTFDIQRDTSIV